jgi:hypothetical protein
MTGQNYRHVQLFAAHAQEDAVHEEGVAIAARRIAGMAASRSCPFAASPGILASSAPPKTGM